MAVGLHSTRLPESRNTRADHPGVPACIDQLSKKLASTLELQQK